MTKIIIINPQDRTITERELEEGVDVDSINSHTRLDAMKKIVAGKIGNSIELAMEVRAPNGGIDDLYVNEEGLYEPSFQFFEFHGGHQPFSGTGFLIGTEVGGVVTDVNHTLTEVIERVRFLDRTRLGKWGRFS